MRLDKYVSFCGFGTRSIAKQLIKKRLVVVNEVVITQDGYQVKEESDVVVVNGTTATYQKNIYLMLHKPSGYLSANVDPKHATVFDLIDHYQHRDLFCVGRLDLDTEGLLLICDDGDLAHRLLSPKYHVSKRYEVQLAHALRSEDISKLEDGIVLEDGYQCMPANITFLGECFVVIEIFEGKFHQVKRMFQCVNNEVVYLKRIQMGSLLLDPLLRKGAYRKLSQEEVDSLRQD